MESPVELLIGDLNTHNVTISFLSRPYPDAKEEWDRNVIRSDVRVCVGGFRGHYEALIWSWELQSFEKELRALDSTLKGKASFKTLQNQIEFDLEGDGKGHVTLRGTARDSDLMGNELSFRLGLDQTYLATIIRGLKNALDRFPVVGRR